MLIGAGQEIEPEGRPVSATSRPFATAKSAGAAMHGGVLSQAQITDRETSAAWKEMLGRNFPPSTLLYIGGLVDDRAKVEIEVTAFVPTA